MGRGSFRGGYARRRHRAVCEWLEPRTHLSITWTNRGAASDGITATFGASAAAARAVIDATIDHWERVITDFNHTFGNNVDLTFQMRSGAGDFGAATSMTSVDIGTGSPLAATISIGKGNDTNGDGQGDGAGYFLDPTPNDWSEFTGLLHAFTANATPGGPADGLADLYTLVLHEIGHAMGMNGHPISDYPSGFAVDTGIADASNGNGTYWAWNSPGGRFLLTDFNSGGGGTDTGVPIHWAAPDPGGAVSFGGNNYFGVVDLMNAFYSFSQRQLVSNALRRVLHDSYEYSSVDPERFGTFHQSLNETTGVLTITGGIGDSDDTITIQNSGTNLYVGVNVGADVPGTGPTDSFDAFFPAASVTSIVVNAGDGDDVIVYANPTQSFPVTLSGGAGDDTFWVDSVAAGATLDIQGGDDDDTLNAGVFPNTLSGILGDVTFTGGAGSNVLLLDDEGNGLDHDFTITFNTITRTGLPGFTYSQVADVTARAGAGDNVFNVNSTSNAAAYTLRSNAGFSTLNLAPVSTNLNSIGGAVTFYGGSLTTNVFLFDHGNTFFPNYTISADTFGPTRLTRTSTHMLTAYGVDDYTLSSGFGDNDYIVESVEAATEWTINAGGGDDTIEFSPTAGNLTNAHSVTFNAGSGTADAAVLHDESEAGATIYSIYANAVYDGSLPILTHSGLESLDLRSGGGDGTFNVYVTLEATPVTISAGSGSDLLRLSPTDQNLDNLAGRLTYHGGGLTGVDAIEINDHLNGFADSWDLDTSSITRFGFRLDYDQAESLTIHAGSGASPFRIRGNAAGLTTTVNANNGADTFNVGSVTNTVAAVLGNLVLNGGADTTDALNYFDASNAFHDQYALTATTLTRTASALVTYAAVESIVVNAGTGNNLINVSSKPAAVPVTVNGGAGTDDIVIGGPAGNAEQVDGVITVNGGDGADVLYFSDGNNPFADGYTITAATVTRTAAGVVTFATVEGLDVTAGTSGNTINVNATGAGVPVTVRGGGGADTINIVPTLNNLANLAAAVTVDGGLAADALVISDTANAAHDAYNVTSTSVSRAGAAGVAFTTVESLTLSAGGGNNTFNVAGTATGTNVTLLGGAGNDRLAFVAPLRSHLTFDGGTHAAGGPGDTVDVVGDGVVNGAFLPSGAAPGFGTIAIGGFGINYLNVDFFGFAPVSVKGFAIFSFVSPNSADNITVDSSGGGGENRIRGSSGGFPFDWLSFFSIANFILDLGANDAASPNDVTNIEFPGLVASGLATFTVRMGAGDNTLNVNAGTFTFNNDGGVDSNNLTVNVNGAGSAVNFNASQHLAALNLANGTRATFAANGSRFLRTRGLTIGATGKLELADNDLIWDYPAGASTYAAARQFVINGRTNPGGNGGIRVNPGAGDVALAVVDNALLGRTSWLGETIGPNTVIGKYTYFGDANLDGAVTGDDYLAIDSNLGIAPETRQWLHGDFNFDAAVTGDDYLAIDANLGKGTPTPLAFAEAKDEMAALHAELFGGKKYLKKLEALEASYEVRQPKRPSSSSRL